MRACLFVSGFVACFVGVSAACVGDPAVNGPADSGAPDTFVPLDAGSDAHADTGADATDASIDTTPPPPSGDLLWAADFGSSGDDDSNATELASAVDSAGNVYVGGSFQGTIDFGGGKLLTSLGYEDAFIAKFDGKGNCVAVSRIGGKSTFDAVESIAIDPMNGDIVVAGRLENNNAVTPPFSWSVNAGGDRLSSAGLFLVRLSGDLTTLKFAQDLLPATGSGIRVTVAIGPSGASALAGTFVQPFGGATSIPFGSTSQPASGLGGPSVGFVAEYDASGNFVFARILSSLTNGICETFLGGVGFDSKGMLVAFGTAGGFDTTKTCNYTADYANNQTKADFSQNPSTFALLLLKYDTSKGGKFAQATVTSTTTAFGYPLSGLAISKTDDVYATFNNQSSAPFTFGAGNVPKAQSDDALVLHYDNNGAESSFLAFGSVSSDFANGVAADSVGNVVVTGAVGGDVALGGACKALKGAGGNDAFIAKFDAKLASCIWANGYANAGNEAGGSVSIGPGDVIAGHGSFDDVSLSMGGGKSISTKGGTDGFAVLLKP